MSELPQTKTGDSGSSLTPSTSDIPSPEGTVVDVDAVCKEKQLGKQSIDEPSPPSTKFEVQLEAQSQGEGNLTKLSPSRKWFLLLVFSVAQVGRVVHCLTSVYADNTISQSISMSVLYRLSLSLPMRSKRILTSSTRLPLGSL